MYNPACCVLALLYGCIHRSVEKFCRDPADRAGGAPRMGMREAESPAAPGIPGATALAAGGHCTKTMLHAAAVNLYGGYR